MPSADAQHMMMGGQESDKSYNEQRNFKLMKPWNSSWDLRAEGMTSQADTRVQTVSVLL